MPQITFHTWLNQESEPRKERSGEDSGFGALMRESFEARARKDGVAWSPGEVAQRIVQCRADCYGIPVFRTRFAGKEMLVNGEPVVLMVCYRGGDRCSGTFFVNVPEDQVDAMRQQSGEWKLFLQKWDEADLLPRRVRQRIGAALSAPVQA